MPASLRLELFHPSPVHSLPFYTTALQFQILQRKVHDSYIFLRRDDVYLALVQYDHHHPSLPSSSSSSSPHPPPTPSSPPLAAPATIAHHRQPPLGVEIVLEVDDLQAERDRVVACGWSLEEDVTLREWGLVDFRVLDPAGYYLRVTTRSPGRDQTDTGMGEGTGDGV